jgi:hypothetical protein
VESCFPFIAFGDPHQVMSVTQRNLCIEAGSPRASRRSMASGSRCLSLLRKLLLGFFNLTKLPLLLDMFWVNAGCLLT